MFAVTVSIRLSKGRTADFLHHILQNATLSKLNEPGCHQFDVCTDPELPDTVFLYEVYESNEAFQHHMTTPHFADFNAAVAEMIDEKTIRSFGEVRQ